MIYVNNICLKYTDRAIAGIHNLSFTLPKGEVMAIIGPNGSGKTTLLKIIARNIKVDTGELILNSDATIFAPEKIPYDLNVQAFLLKSITLELDDEKKIQLCRDLADTFDFTFQLKQTINELSSGQLQKILLAAFLINRPRLILLDEPFNQLDPFTRNDILESLFNYIRNQGITVLWVTHDLNEAFKFSNKIGVMNFGKFEQISNPLTLLKNPKSLFVAKFIGFRNFFIIKPEQSQWLTPWGKVSLGKISAEEAILVVPDNAWLSSETGQGFTVKNIFASHQSIEYVLTGDNRTIYWVRGTQDQDLSVDESLNLSPIWDKCFHIPL